MNRVQDAMDRFSALDFTVTHHPRVEPLNQPKEIAKYREALNYASDLKTLAFYRALLREQVKGEPEQVTALKAFSSFEGFRWQTNNRPHMEGGFTPHDSQYRLVSFSRFPEEVTDMKMLEVFWGRSILPTGPDSPESEMIKHLCEVARRQANISERIEFTYNVRVLSPPTVLSISGDNLENIHSELVDAMHKIGYRDGVVYRGPEAT